jgi:adenylate kinase family enzyme
VLVYGVTGSGKTTLARQISERTALPWHSVDELTWEPGWVSVPLPEQRQRIAVICAQDRWILDTAYGQWLDLPMATVQLVAALDYPRWFSLARLIWRSVRRGVSRELVCNGNTESLLRMLSSDSIIVWHFRSFARKRARIRAWAADPSGPAVIRLTSPAATRRWLATLSAADRPASR